MWMCRGQRLPGVLFYHYPSNPLRQGPCLNLELDWQPASPSGVLFLPIPPQSCRYRCVWTHLAFYMSAGIWTQVLTPAQQGFLSLSPLPQDQLLLPAFLLYFSLLGLWAATLTDWRCFRSMHWLFNDQKDGCGFPICASLQSQRVFGT